MRPHLASSVVGLAVIMAGCPNPRNECEPEPTHCEGAVLVSCTLPVAEVGASYTLSEVDCTDTREVCVDLTDEEGERTAICAAAFEPSPLCADEPQHRVCDGTELVTCTHGYEVDRAGCEVDCVASEGHDFCVLSTEPDPRCPEARPDIHSTVCDGRHVLDCIEGYLAGTRECEPGTVCSDSDNGEPPEDRVHTARCVDAIPN